MKLKCTKTLAVKPASKSDKITLCHKVKFDSKNRIIVPKDIFNAVQAAPNKAVYISHEEGSNVIKIIIKEENNDNLNNQN